MAVFALIVLACNKQQAPPEVTHSETTAPAAPRVTTVPIRVKVVDREGMPVPNMLPIATKQPNAFDVPVAKGDFSGADGMTTLEVPGNEYLYVRAWDPGKQMFANNYYDVLPGNAPPSEILHITMLPGAMFRADIMGPDGAPLVNQPIGMMMRHPVHGPWWPSEAQTDEQGRAQFGPVPPGKYGITIESRDHLHVELPEQTLLPRQTTNVGPITLR